MRGVSPQRHRGTQSFTEIEIGDTEEKIRGTEKTKRGREASDETE